MAGALVSIAFHPEGGAAAPITAHHANGLAWMNINHFVEPGYVKDGPCVTVHFSTRAEVLAVIAQLEGVAARMLEDLERQHDAEALKRDMARRARESRDEARQLAAAVGADLGIPVREF
jgi:hypothetical protein